VVHQPGEARAQYSWMDHSLRSLASPVRTALSTLGISSRDSYTFKAFSTGGKETDIEGLPCCNNWPRRLSLYPTAEWEQYWWRQAEPRNGNVQDILYEIDPELAIIQALKA
jgi:hypothetical protein